MRLPQSLLLLVALAVPAFAQDDEPLSGPAGAAIGQPAPVAQRVSRPAPPPPLASALAPLTEDALFSTAAVSLQVVNVRTGEEVYAWGEDRPLLPASTMKLLTTAAALRTLGPDFRFATWVLAGGELDGAGVLDGNLYVRGQGDPTMVVERMWRLAHDLKLRGLREVSGDIVFDESYFSGPTTVPGWDKEHDIESGPTYFATLGALSVNQNVATIVVRPGEQAGEAAIAEFDSPTAAVVLKNEVGTGSKTSRAWVKIDRRVDPETGKITTFNLTGNLPAGGTTERYHRTIADPLGNYIGLMQLLFKQHGIRVRGSWGGGVTAASATLLVKAESEPLAEIVAATSKQSNNFMAEQLLRVIGAERLGLPGTTEKGALVVADYLQSLGIQKDQFHLINGSGLSRDITLRPSAVNAVLIDMHHSPEFGPEYVASLSVGGRDGTLRSRFREDGMAGRVRGKTGTLAGVHCLAGYIHAADDEIYAFTFLVNEIDGALSRARKVHDRLVLTVAGTTGNLADGSEGELPAP